MPTAPLYPLFLNLTQCPVLVVGGGAVALRKARGLVESAARVMAVSPRFDAGFDALHDIERVTAPYAATHMARKMWRLVFAATDVRAVNEQVYKHAAAAGILCCRCDDPDEGDFTGGAMRRIGATKASDGRGVKAVGKLGGVTVVVGTTGASPRLAARICRQAADAVDPVLPALADLLAGWRSRAKVEVPEPSTRRSLLQRAAGAEMEVVLREGGGGGAEGLFAQWLREARTNPAAFVMACAAADESGGGRDSD